jgi:putative acetyltransferase
MALDRSNIIMRIREFEPEDAPVLADLYARSVRHFGPRSYSPEQVEAWASTATTETIAARCKDGRVVLVGVDEDDRPIAYGDLEDDGHLDFLYCAPEAGGRGNGGHIYAALEGRARQMGLGKIYVEASELARPLFERNGFTVVSRNDLSIGGVPIHNFAMEKTLIEKL